MAKLPTVKQLRYLVALEKHLHFGRAAAACFVTQSAFSTAIKELETSLGVSLVERTSRRVVMTSTGRLIAQRARLTLLDLEGIVDIAKTVQEPLSGVLKVGVIPTVAPFLLPKILPHIRRRFPKLDIYLKEEQTGNIHRLLLAGELDVLLLALPYELTDTETISMFNDPFKLAYKKGTSLFDPHSLSPDGLKEGSIFLLEEGHCLREHILRACNVWHVDKLNRFSAGSLHSLIQMVAADLGVTFVPQMAVDGGLLRNTDIQVGDLKDGAYREIGLAWRKSSVRKPEFKLLADTISAYVKG